MVRRDKEFKVFILKFLVFGKGDTDRQIDISIEIGDVGINVSQISDIGLAWQSYFVLVVSSSALDLAKRTCDSTFLE